MRVSEIGSFMSREPSIVNAPVKNLEEIFSKEARAFKDPIVSFTPKKIDDGMSHN